MGLLPVGPAGFLWDTLTRCYEGASVIQVDVGGN